MPNLPEYQQRTRASGPIPDLATNPNYATGAAVALERISQNVDRVREHDDNVDVGKALADLRLKSAQRMVEGEASAADDADGFTPARLKEFDDDVAEIAETTRSPTAAALFKQHSQQMRSQIGERAVQFEASRRSAYRAEAAEQALSRSRAVLELDPSQYEAIRAEQLGSIPTLGLEPAQRLAMARQIDANLAEGASIGLAKKNPGQFLAMLADPARTDPRITKLSPEQRSRLEVYAKNQLAETTADAIVDQYRRDALAGTQALVALEKSDMPKDMQNLVRSQVREGVGLLHAERRQQFNDQVTALERSITQERPPANAENQAHALYRKGVYSPEQYTNVLQAIDESRQRAAKSGAEIVTVTEAIASGQRLDPKNEKVVKAVDAVFTESMRVNQIKPGSDEWINNAALIAKRTNILPPEAMSWARKTLLSGEPDLAVPAANAMARFADAAPAAYAYFDDPVIKANAEAIDGLVRAGVPNAKAVEIARANTFDIPKARQDALKATYTKEKYAADNASELEDRMDGDDAFEVGIAGTSPPAPLEMRDEYNGLVRTYFDHTNGDIKRARELAWKDIRGTYGVSTVNGEPEVLKYAPELVFPGVDPAVIRSDIDTAAKGAGVETPVRLSPAPRVTGDTHGLLWHLSTVDEDGHAEVLLDDKNRPLVYAIPTDTATYLKAQEEAKRKAVDAARATSARLREFAASQPDGSFPGY